jgi:hypothetical protein
MFLYSSFSSLSLSLSAMFIYSFFPEEERERGVEDEQGHGDMKSMRSPR